RALEPPLPDMTRSPMPLVIPPGMGHGEGLEDAADRLTGLGAEQEVEVVGHEAVAEEAERIALLGPRQSFDEGASVGVVLEDVGAVITTVEGVVDQALADGSR